MSTEPVAECAWLDPPCYSAAAWDTPLCKRHVIACEKIAWQHRPDTIRRRDHLANRQEALDAQAQVYYVRIGDVIKIGTTQVMTDRMRSLRVRGANVLATEPGSFELEKIRHEQFAHLRRGRVEDFTPADELMSHIAMLIEHFGPPKMTEPPRLLPGNHRDRS